MNFDESLSFLLSLGNEVLAMKLGLESTEKLLAALGNPQENFLKIQIAGTNGKGSTCAFLDSICRQAGIKSGLSTSPHLISITERIKINGVDISEEDFARHATKVRQSAEKLVEAGELEALPTFFEQVTAIAVSAFAEAEVELAILETGLGGRFDSTTATRAEIVAITPVDYDHQSILGNTLAEIAAEKAAIIREDAKVIIAPQKKEAEQVIIGKCREEGIKPTWATTDISIKKDDPVKGEALFSVSFKTVRSSYPNIELGLFGKHQVTNASTAISLAETLDEFGFKISGMDICTGLKNARHRGRLEYFHGMLFDGAHNTGGAKALKEFLDEFINKPITLIFGAMRDKDLSEISQILFSKAERLILTEPDNPRSMKAEDLMKFLPEDFDREKAFQIPAVKEALKFAREISANGLICVTGSLYLVGEAQKILLET